MIVMSKKRIVSALSLVAALAMMICTVNPTVAKSIDALDVSGLDGNTAGIIDTVTEMQVSATLSASVENSTVSVVATSDTEDVTEGATEGATEDVTTEGVTETEATGEVVTIASQENSEWATKLMATVEESLNVRATADAEGEIVGKLRAGDVAEITETLDGWYGITSGNVTGYVSAEYCVTGDEAYALSLEVCKTYAKAEAGGVRVRSTPSTDGSIMTVLGQDDTIECDLDAESVDGWVAVISGDETGYVSADYVTVYTDYSEAITVEEEAAAEAEAAAQAAEEKAQATATQNAAVAASVDDTTLLAALIQCEAGSECYEGQVAVGAVVVNRLRRGYASSIYGVIYQSGQFPPAASGSVAAVAASGPSSSCMQAAAQALSGYDNTGGATGFANVRSGKSGVVIGNHVFY